jgi:hypothetical protein
MITILLEVTLTKYSSSLKKNEIDSLVLPLSVVDNSVCSLNGLTLPIDPAYPSC